LAPALITPPTKEVPGPLASPPGLPGYSVYNSCITLLLVSHCVWRSMAGAAPLPYFSIHNVTPIPYLPPLKIRLVLVGTHEAINLGWIAHLHGDHPTLVIGAIVDKFGL